MEPPEFLESAAELANLRTRRGLLGERLALKHLEQQGYALRTHRYRTTEGEVDLVMEGSEGWVFVEVKTRSSSLYGDAVEALTPLKLHRLLRVAHHYRARYNCRGPWRLDLITVDLRADETLDALHHFQDITQ